MICFIVARGFQSTLKPLLCEPAAPHVTPLFYDETLQKPALANATYIFTDLDRLSVDELIAAARLYRRLQESGCRVLNDPATVRKRFALLRGLHLGGFNPNNIHLADEGWSKVKFPVFIRVADGHDGPLTDLIHNQAELETALEAAVVAGIPRSTIVIVEYAAEPIRPGLYRKSSIHRVGERLITAINWHARDWRVKGDEYVADEALYDEELSMVRENRYASQAWEAFKFANIEYGRMDFGVVKGRLCIYEINTNPTHFSPGQHSVPQRMESSRLRWSRFLEALHAIDTEENSAEIEVEGSSVEAWNRASKLCPKLRVPRRLLSQEQERRGNLELALRYAEEALAANPSSPAWFNRLAKLLDKQGRPEQAVAAVRKALELSPKEGPHYVLLANILLKAGRYAEARDCAEEAITLRAESWEPYLLLSEAQWRLGALEDAHRSARRAAELNSEEPSVSKWWRTVSQHLADKYLKAGRYAEARDCLREAIVGAEANGISHFLLSEACLKLGDFRGALRAAARAADLAPEQAQVHDDRRAFYIVMKAMWWLARFRSRLDHRLRAFKIKAGWVAR
jgi:Flp pilus assembly protein TadD